MLEKDFLPKFDEQLLRWLNNFSNQLSVLNDSLGITVAETAALNSLINDVRIDIRNGYRDEEQEVSKKVMLKYLRHLVEKIKKHPSYMESIGKKLGIA